MKKYYYVFILLILLACEDPIKGDLGQPLSKIDGINGSWELVSVIQTDEQAPNKRQLDLSEYYDAFVLNFDTSDFSFFIDSTLAISGNNFLVILEPGLFTILSLVNMILFILMDCLL